MADPTFTDPPTPTPDRTQSNTAFSAAVTAFLSWLQTFVTEMGTSITWMRARVSEVAATALSGDLPDITGKEGDALVVNSDATAVAFAPASKPENLLINSNFDIWQRGTSQTSTGYGSADRWRFTGVGTTFTASRQDFAIGQTDVPGNLDRFLRVVTSSVAGAGNVFAFEQRIEGVQTLSGQTATVTFWAKADAAKDICTVFRHYFGTGGSPSVDVHFAPTTISLTTSWQKFCFTVSVPSVFGNDIGSDGNDFLSLGFYLDAGSDYDTLTNSLGHQSGTFDFAHVSVVSGDATALSDPAQDRTYADELSLCQRYYETMVYDILIGWFSSGITYYAPRTFQVSKRATPALTFGNEAANAMGAASPNTISAHSFSWGATASGTSVYAYRVTSWAADAEL